MTSTSIVISSVLPFELVPTKGDASTVSRLALFAAWLRTTSGNPITPDLAAYRDYLLQGKRLNLEGKRLPNLTGESAKTHLSTIRGQYRHLIETNDFREYLYSVAPDGSPADRAAFVFEVTARLENNLRPSAALVRTIKRQDVADAEHGLRLTEAQANELLAAPGIASLKGLRDTALLALMLATGLREAEVVALDVADLRQRLNGSLALHVRKGKGFKARLVPYGQLEFTLAIADAWLQAAGIESGPVFRGFYKGARLRPNRLTTRAVNDVMGDYPQMIDGQLVKVRPHDLRRTYARLLHNAGMEMMSIRDNLGHADIQTTQRYIGMASSDKRQPPKMLRFDMKALAEVQAIRAVAQPRRTRAYTRAERTQSAGHDQPDALAGKPLKSALNRESGATGTNWRAARLIQAALNKGEAVTAVAANVKQLSDMVNFDHYFSVNKDRAEQPENPFTSIGNGTRLYLTERGRLAVLALNPDEYTDPTPGDVRKAQGIIDTGRRQRWPLTVTALATYKAEKSRTKPVTLELTEARALILAQLFVGLVPKRTPANRRIVSELDKAGVIVEVSDKTAKWDYKVWRVTGAGIQVMSRSPLAMLAAERVISAGQAT